MTVADPLKAPVVLRGHEDDLSSLAISSDGKWLVTGSEDRTARLWDLAAVDPSRSSIVLRGHEGKVLAVAIVLTIIRYSPGVAIRLYGVGP